MNNIKGSECVLAGDIGGTKTSLGIFRKGKSRPVLKHFAKYSSAEFSGLEDIVEIFLTNFHSSVKNACFGIAGPVENGRCRTTNLPWNVHESKIQKRFGFENTRLINDLSAMALAVPCLNKTELVTIKTGKTKKHSNIGLLAPGTGLGQSIIFYHEGIYFPIPSEGGHTDFAPQNELEINLWRYLNRKYERVSLERILSGPGIYGIYEFLRDTGIDREPPWLADRIMEIDPARAITEAALNGRQRLCVKTLDMFISILGAAAGNLALTAMTRGGVYLGGGIPPKIIPLLEKEMFINAFTNKGRFKYLMDSIPVYVILNERSGLLGAAVQAFAEQPANRNGIL